MAINVNLDLTSDLLKQKIYVKTNIGGWFFDAFLRVDHTSRLSITSHPVQTGANISDHAFLEPQELNIEIGMSDVATSLINGQFSEGWSRSVTAYQVLKELQKQRIPVQVMTRLGLYQNMLIEVISAPDNYQTLFGLRATVTLKEIIVASVTTVKVSSRPQITGATNRGTQEAISPAESVLRSMAKARGLAPF